jgi:hypothetical protein
MSINDKDEVARKLIMVIHARRYVRGPLGQNTFYVVRFGETTDVVPPWVRDLVTLWLNDGYLFEADTIIVRLPREVENGGERRRMTRIRLTHKGLRLYRELWTAYLERQNTQPDK